MMLKVFVYEKFGDGIISVINFWFDVKKVDDFEGGLCVVIMFDGKYLLIKLFWCWCGVVMWCCVVLFDVCWLVYVFVMLF